MSDGRTIYPPEVGRASRPKGPRSGTAPNNQVLSKDGTGASSKSTSCRGFDEPAHDTTDASRAAEVVPASQPSVLTLLMLQQQPGCLPSGFGLDSLLTVEQFAIWQQVSVATARAALPSMRGVVRRSREWQRIHPRTFLELTLKTKYPQ